MRADNDTVVYRHEVQHDANAEPRWALHSSRGRDAGQHCFLYYLVAHGVAKAACSDPADGYLCVFLYFQNDVKEV